MNLSSLHIERPEESPVRRRRPQKRKLLWTIIIVSVIGLSAAVLSFAFRPAQHVETTTVQLLYPTQLARMLVASGYVVAQRKAAVASKGTGRLVELNVVEGDHVRKDDVIARIESGDIEAQLAQSKSNLELARATLLQAQAESTDATAAYTRVKALMQSGSSSKADYDIAEARYKRALAGVKSAEAGIRAAQAAVRAVEVSLENTNIRAPFDGTVLTKNADIGEMVAPFGAAANARGAVVTIADMRSLEVEADVSETNIQKVVIGQPCEITLDAFPSIRYPAAVAKIVPTADRAKATVLTKIRFASLDARVLPEMSAKVSFLPMDAPKEIFTQRPKVVVNAAALMRRKDGDVVFAVKNGVLSMRRVTLGKKLGASVEILAGIGAGETVVINPTETLSDGMSVSTDKE